MNINLEEFGYTKEQLWDCVINKISDSVVKERFSEYEFEDEDGEICTGHRKADDVLAKLTSKFEEVVKKTIDEKIKELGDKHVAPKVNEIIDNVVMQKTNRWGEKLDRPRTFIEYLIERAEEYMEEKVDYEGKKPDSYGRATQTRICFLVEKHLHFSISQAMQKALESANSQIANGITETVKMKLNELLQSMKVKVEVPRP